MEWLRIIALAATMADGAYTCKQINSGAGIESNPLMPKTCKGIMIQKSLIATPMFVIKHKGINKALTFSVLAGGSVGISLSIYNMNKSKP